MSAHTPGPWRIVVEGNGDMLLEDFDGVHYPSTDYGIVNGSEEQLSHPQGFSFLAHLNSSAGDALSNARLISAAPDLLEALQDLLEAPDLNLDELENETGMLMQNAKAAIKKAKGEE